jgi:hypothetical protein
MNAFYRQWIDRDQDAIMIVRTGNRLEIMYGRERDSFIRTEIDSCAPAIPIDDGDLRACNTGVLTRNGNIRWSDDVRRHQESTARRRLVNSSRDNFTGSRYS